MARRSSAPNNGIPFLHEKQIEAEADVLLAEFGERFSVVTEPPVPVNEIAKLLSELSLEYHEMNALYPMADVHEAIWCAKRRIGIDKDLAPDTNPSHWGRYHFTLAHEVGHWRLHRQHYLKNPAERPLFDDCLPKPDVVCQSIERKRPAKWLADSFAANLLMLRNWVFAAWSNFRGGDDRPVELWELHAASSVSPLFYRGQLASTKNERHNAFKRTFVGRSRNDSRFRVRPCTFVWGELDLIVRERPATLF